MPTFAHRCGASEQLETPGPGHTRIREVNGQRAQRVHFVGVGGAGLSGLARILLARGAAVSGSDREDGPRLEELRRLGARVQVGHRAEALGDPDLVIVSSAIRDDNPELLAARRRGIPVKKREQWLPELTAGHDLLAVAGTHGKTTTTSLLALVLEDAKQEPTAVIGGEVPQLGGNALAGGGRWFVLEADEYDGAFSGLRPFVAVVTNVEYEHPDCFRDEAAVRRAFAAFAARVRPEGRLVVCGDDPGALAVLGMLPAGHAPVVTYGLGAGHDWHAGELRPNADGGTDFRAGRRGEPGEAVGLRLPGRHNVRNALAVLAVAAELGLPWDGIAATLGRFTGAARRFQPVGSAGGVEVVDDYAHHPTEVRATLQAARQRAGDLPVWVVFQPHTFSRVAALIDDFATAFEAADRVWVTDIYAARERNTVGVHAADLVARVAGPPAVHVPDGELLERLAAELPERALVLTLGAGDVTAFGPQLLAVLRGRADRADER